VANDTVLNTPILWINKYLQNKLFDFGFDGVPFFPAVPSTLDALTQGGVINNNGVMATYDRMFRMNRNKFPHIKNEQILYYFYATEENSVLNMVQITETVYRLLDRSDESAQEINNWCSNRRINLGTEQNQDLVDNMFYFHDFKVYQLEEVRDIIDFGTARTYAGNKVIIDFDYHQMPELTNNSWTPESNLTGENKITI